MVVATVDYRPAEDWRHLFLWWAVWLALVALPCTNALVICHFAERNRATQHEAIDFALSAPEPQRAHLRRVHH